MEQKTAAKEVWRAPAPYFGSYPLNQYIKTFRVFHLSNKQMLDQRPILRAQRIAIAPQADNASNVTVERIKGHWT